MTTPFNRFTPVGPELDTIAEAIRQGTSGGGVFGARCERLLEQLATVPRALLTTSCTHALDMAALLLDVLPGDEVIAPSFTFPSTVNAFVLRGARPVFADVRPDTLNLDERLLPSLMGPRTRAIVLVHYGGVACEMDAIVDLARTAGVAVVEDNAHGLFGRYKGRSLGSFGALATLSFHETKNVSCGEGGALLVNDPSLVERAEVIREKGTDRSRFFRGEVDRYTWRDVGSSYVLSDILAAVLWVQLGARRQIQDRRRAIWRAYERGLRSWASERNVGLPVVPPYCEQPYHLFYLLLPSQELRDRLIAHLRGRGIMAVFHYQPLHASEMGSRTARQTECPVTEDISGRLVRLPLYAGLTDEEQQKVIDAITELNW